MNNRLVSVFFLLIHFFPIVAFPQKGSTCPEDLVPKFGANRQWGYTNLIGEWIVQPIYTKVSPFVDNKAVVMKGTLYGVVDCEGNMVLPPQYESMTNYRYGKFWAKQKALWGLIDAKGIFLIQPSFAEIAPIPNTEFTWVKKGELWGLLNEKSGGFLCKPQFKIAQIMSENASLVEVGDKFGVVNHVNCQFLITPNITKVKKLAPRVIIFKQEGKWGLFSEFGVLRLKPDYDTLLLKYNNLVEARLNGKSGLFDLTGKEILACEYDYIGNYSDGYFIVKKQNKYGYATRFGKLFIAPLYDNAQDFYNNKAIVQKGTKSGIIDIKNKVLLPIQYNYLERSKDHSFIVVQEKGKDGKEKMFFYDDKLKKISEQSFDSININDPTNFIRVVNQGKYYFYDLNQKKLIISSGFDDVGEINENFAVVKDHAKYGVIDKKGKEIIQIVYDSLKTTHWGNRQIFLAKSADEVSVIETSGKLLLKDRYDLIYFVQGGLLKVRKNNLYGVIKTSGDIVAPIQYQLIFNKSIPAYSSYPEWPAVISKENKFGLINEKGEEIVKPEFLKVALLQENLFAFSNAKNSVIYNAKGEPVTEDKYDEVGQSREGLIAVKKGKKWGFINTKGIIIIPYEFSEVSAFSGKCAVVRKNEQYGVIDLKGKFIVNPEYQEFKLEDGQRKMVKDTKKFILTEGCQVIEDRPFK